MNPKATASQNDPGTSNATPFDQIASVEQQEEERAQQILSALEEESREAEKAMKHSELAEEEAMREAARKDLRAFAKKEPAEIFARVEKEMQVQLKTIDDTYQRNAKTLSTKLTKSLLSSYSLAA